ncbi:MAG TPA: SelL-related redox protein [Pirellulaceae bacterium]|nr:SelL-related redox protein [Pirellulaceae bacterium]
MNADLQTCDVPKPPRASAEVPRWIVWSLRAAGIYNLVWGAWVILFPAAFWSWLELPQPNYPALWQCIGMVIGVYGVGYWIAARDPARHWPIVLVGWLGKVLGPIGMLYAALRGNLPWSFGIVNVWNDLIWWWPFSAALYYAWRANSAPPVGAPLNFAQAVGTIRSQRGRTLAELSAPSPLLVVFVRHAGCTFCREALADVAAAKQDLDRAGTALAVVHMSTATRASELLEHYSLGDIDQFSDPACRLFQAFELARGNWWQLLGPPIWWRGLTAIFRHGLGPIDGDGFQMPGAFLLRGGRIARAYRHRTAADRPDYVKLAAA